MALTGSNELQLLPAGRFSARDGRPKDAPGWFVDATLANALIAQANARSTPFVIDYEHQTMLTKTNGQPAPAAGWFKSLEWREGLGLFAVDVSWTERALSWIASGEYKFISPVLGYDKASGAVNTLFMAAITNNPAIDGMDEVLLSAAALHFNFPATPLTTENPMEELLEQLRWMLNLPVGSTSEEIQAQLQKLIGLIKQDPTATAAASFDLAGWISAQRTAVVSLSAQLSTSSTQTPDPAKYVGIGVMQSLQTQVASLSAELNGGRVQAVVSAAMAANKLLPQQESWAREWGAKDLVALSAYIDNAPPIALLAGMQTGGKAPLPQAGALTQNQVALCAVTGVSEADFLKTLQGETLV
jgi:phage I-like protein